MIVDDSPTEVHVMKTALEKHGFETMSAADGSECLSLAREVRPDLIFMDVVMPGVNGFQATRALTRDPLTKTIPIVMITTKDQETDRIWGMPPATTSTTPASTTSATPTTIDAPPTTSVSTTASTIETVDSTAVQAAPPPDANGSSVGFAVGAAVAAVLGVAGWSISRRRTSVESA
jgi:twitching motility two-component system response regulator PilH